MTTPVRRPVANAPVSILIRFGRRSGTLTGVLPWTTNRSWARNTADFGDKILELIDDLNRCREMGTYGRQRVRDELSWEREEPKLIAAYEALFK